MVNFCTVSTLKLHYNSAGIITKDVIWRRYQGCCTRDGEGLVDSSDKRSDCHIAIT